MEQKRREVATAKMAVEERSRKLVGMNGSCDVETVEARSGGSSRAVSK